MNNLHRYQSIHRAPIEHHPTKAPHSYKLGDNTSNVRPQLRESVTKQDIPSLMKRSISNTAFFCCSINDYTVSLVDNMARENHITTDLNQLLPLISEAMQLSYPHHSLNLNQLARYEQKIAKQSIDISVKRFCLLMANGKIDFCHLDFQCLGKLTYKSALADLQEAVDNRCMNTARKALADPKSEISIELESRAFDKKRAQDLQDGLMEAYKKKARKTLAAARENSCHSYTNQTSTDSKSQENYLINNWQPNAKNSPDPNDFPIGHWQLNAKNSPDPNDFPIGHWQPNAKNSADPNDFSIGHWQPNAKNSPDPNDFPVGHWQPNAKNSPDPNDFPIGHGELVPKP